MKNVGIHINGSIEDYYGGTRFITKLRGHYYVTNVPERKIPLMGDPMPQPLQFTFQINTPLLQFLGTAIVIEAGKYVLKRYFFEPFFDELESLETYNEHLSIGFFVFEYEDITIKVGYSRKNQINVVSYLNMELIKRVNGIRATGHGSLDLIATAVEKESGEWHFQDSSTKDFNSFLINWGLQFNAGNRMVYHLKPEQYSYKHWWD